ncbi:type II toxin-antitoxin system VapC family toxin [Cryobacterium sp. PH31-O1]|uniref:type II toxin-antitoxin system VapC family toxin n=1 Tax=Cryobacterium sp. PH31-O1 TaxID=3046306 RepID=UPI0024BBB40C|nr:type II toxin-antitoxin system VapC family toxin [Cryobacterium sp. PH31-O1]MDJ0338364.1 type II toxin-antitoxin system VapC family toxin [Cryobacterium sp. PH31-O1]
MRLLLDTHALLWALRDPAQLSAEATALIRDPSNELIVSAATAWEIATKHRIGKLPDASPILIAYAEYLQRLGAVELAITSRHALAAGQLDWHHRDPFDRILAAQSMLESLTLVTADATFQSLSGVHTFAAN